MEWLRRSVRWASIRLGRADLAVLLAALAAVVGVLVFVAIAERVSDGPPGRVDERLLLALREPGDPSDPLGPKWLEEAGRDITALGGYAVLSLLVVLVVAYEVMSRRYHAAILVLVATLGGLLVSHLLKDLYDRPRPELVPHLTHVSTSSFPSGHAMLSAVVYLTLGALLARLVDDWWAKLYFIGAALGLTALVGFSRVYLGVHYPTDVLAGWAAGLSWAILCWLAARYLQRHGVVDGDRG
jgi:undecaprenyl-diphosphatase